MIADSYARRWLLLSVVALAAAAILRLATLECLALTDNTESRYADIGWRMCESGDWITPRLYMHGKLVPFWGKPPLAFWLTAASYRTFGVGQWQARLPSFLLAVAIVAATVFYARRQWGARVGMLAGVVLSSSGLFIVLAGACVLDVPLAASVAGAMIAFGCFAESQSHRTAWGLAFFLALAAGALAKGPIALVLVGLALVPWLTIVGRWRLASQLPWLLGLPLFAAVAVPWYLAAERATPGFLWYFLVNEHFLRYVSHDYGDLYGAGRKQPFGMIWLMLFAAFLPWTVLGITAVGRLFWREKILAALRRDPWLTYAMLWGLVPAIFFTAARQILFTYVLPGLPGLAIATAVGLDRWIDSDAVAKLRRGLIWHTAILGGLAIGGAIAAGATYAAPPVLVAISIVATIGVLIIAWTTSRQQDAAAMVAMLGLTAGVAFAAGVVLLAPEIGDKQSAKIVLAQLYRTPGMPERPIVMPMGDDNSAIFYVATAFRGNFEHHDGGGADLIRKRLAARDNVVFLLKQKDWKQLKSEFGDRLTTRAETRHWVACEAATTGKRPR